MKIDQVTFACMNFPPSIGIYVGKVCLKRGIGLKPLGLDEMYLIGSSLIQAEEILKYRLKECSDVELAILGLER